jgi:hypothetical protein
MTTRIIAAAALAVVIAAPAHAQDPRAFRFGTTLSAFGGVAADANTEHPAAGLALGWEITRRVAVEGTTLWAMPGHDQHEFGVVLGPKINLARGRTVVPYIAGGVGLYQASFPRVMANMSPFYADRMGGDVMSTRRTFTDLAATLGGGGEVFVANHWAVRPDIRILQINAGHERRWMTTGVVHLAYHFVSHGNGK